MLVLPIVWNHIHRDTRVPKDSVQVEVLWQDLINEEAN